MDEPLYLDSELQRRRRLPWIIAFIALVAVLIAMLSMEKKDALVADAPAPSLPAPSAPAASTEPEPAAATGVSISAAPKQPGAEARQLIARLSTEGGADAANTAYERAQRLQKARKPADAYLLYFYAARKGNADAAFALASAADPAHHNVDIGLLEVPDPAQAHKWYQIANEAGHPQAATRLDALRAQVEQAAADGYGPAQRLMLQWQ